MNKSGLVFVLLSAVFGCADSTQLPVASAANAATEEQADSAKKFTVGDKAPAFKDLEGTDGKRHSLADYDKAKAVVVVFTCNHCPVAQAYEDRLVALQNDYKDKSVQVVAINVNNLDADKLPAMKERAEERGFSFPYLYDPSQQVGRDFGALVTPHVFLLDQKKQLAYVGPVDDNQNEADVTKKYVRDAIDSLLAANKPEPAEVKPFGCGIRYE